MNSTVESSQMSDHETKLKKHVLKVHKCQPCGKSFARLGSLMKHIHTIHESHKDNKCKFCGKSFSQEGDFKRHIHTVHEGHKDHKCDSCSKQFTTLQKLEIHLHTVHDGYKDQPVETFCFRLRARQQICLTLILLL